MMKPRVSRVKGVEGLNFDELPIIIYNHDGLLNNNINIITNPIITNISHYHYHGADNLMVEAQHSVLLGCSLLLVT